MTIPAIVASLSYINAFSKPIQETLYDIQMLELVKPIKLSFQEIISRPASLKTPIKLFDTIELKNIKKQIGDKLLTIPTLSIKYGEKIVVVGENRSGKSSFLNLLNDTDSNFSGKVYIDGKRTENLDSCFGKIIQKDHAFKASYESNISMFSSFSIIIKSEKLFTKKQTNYPVAKNNVCTLKEKSTEIHHSSSWTNLFLLSMIISLNYK